MPRWNTQPDTPTLPPLRLHRTGHTETDPIGRTWHAVDVRTSGDLPECYQCGLFVHPGGCLFIDGQGGAWLRCTMCALLAPEALIPAEPAPFQLGKPVDISRAVEEEHEGADEDDTESLLDDDLSDFPF